MGCGSSGIKESIVEQRIDKKEENKQHLNSKNKPGFTKESKGDISSTNQIEVPEYQTKQIKVDKLPELESDPNISKLNPIKITLKEIESLNDDEKLKIFDKHAVNSANLRQKIELLTKTFQKGRATREIDSLMVNRKTILIDSVNQISSINLTNKVKVSFSRENSFSEGELLKEWFRSCTKEITKPETNLLIQPNKDEINYLINPFLKVKPENKQYFAFIGKFMAKALVENVSIPLNLNLFVYKQIFNRKAFADDFQLINLETYESLLKVKPKEIECLEMNYEALLPYKDTIEFVELFQGGSKAEATSVRGFCWAYVNYFLSRNLPFVNAIKEELFRIMPEKHFEAFSPEELKVLFEGEPEIIIEDWENSTEYLNLKGEPAAQYKTDSKSILFFWETLGELNNFEKSKFLCLCTGTKRIPSGGFKYCNNKRNS